MTDARATGHWASSSPSQRDLCASLDQPLETAGEVGYEDLTLYSQLLSDDSPNGPEIRIKHAHALLYGKT